MVLGYLTNQYGRASETFIRQEVRLLRELGHVVVTFSIRRPKGAGTDEALHEQSRTIYVLEASLVAILLAVAACAVSHPVRTVRALATAWRISAPGLKGVLWGMFYFVEAAYLARRVRGLGIEHLHNHIATNSASVCMLASIMAGVTWSMTVHGGDEFVDPARWSLATKLQAASFCVFVSEFGRSQAMWHAPLSAWPKFHVVRCGVDAGFLRRGASPVPAQPRLLFVGRLAPEKGVTVLMEAMTRLAAAGVQAHLAVVGDGPCRRDMEQYLARRGLAHTVTFLGWQTTERVREEILASRALVLSSFAEGLPVVLMESLALYRPVISTQVAGIPELVEQGTHGFLVPPGSVEALCAAMRKVLLAPTPELEAMGRHGAARVRALHDASANIRKLESLFAQVIAQASSRASIQERPGPSASVGQ